MKAIVLAFGVILVAHITLAEDHEAWVDESGSSVVYGWTAFTGPNELWDTFQIEHKGTKDGSIHHSAHVTQYMISTDPWTKVGFSLQPMQFGTRSYCSINFGDSCFFDSGPGESCPTVPPKCVEYCYDPCPSC